MSHMAYTELRSLIANLAEGRSNTDIITEIQSKHSRVLREATPFIIQNALTNILKNLRRRPTSALPAGIGDMFGEYRVPSMYSRRGADEDGHTTSHNENLGRMLKSELREKIQKIKNRKNRPPIMLQEYEKLYSDLDAYCEDGESLEVGMKRKKGL